MSRKPVLRVRKSGALVVAALIAFVGTVPFAGARWELAPVLLIPLAILAWAWRAGTDVHADARNGISALLNDGRVLRLTGVTTANLPAVLAAGGQAVNTPETPDEPTAKSQPDNPADEATRAD